MLPTLLDDHPIAALVTSPGTSAVAIIRISGFQLLDRLYPILRHPNGYPVSHSDLIPRLLKRLNLIDPQTHQTLDQTMVVYFPAPHSYTGEEVVEIQGHGALVLIQRTLEILGEIGIRPAKPGEFTRRACMNGKLDLTQAEAIAALINASSMRAAREALRQLEGSLQQPIETLRERLLTVLAHVEASLDFADEDIDPLPSPMILQELSQATEALGKLLRGAPLGERLREGFHLVIIGRPNVGKSSLFNHLLGRKRAIVSPTPGTTRDCIESSLEIAGIPVILLDTAGLRTTDEPIEAEGIALTREKLRQADGVLMLLDAESGLTPEDQDLLNDVADSHAIVVWNKMDLYTGAYDLHITTTMPTARVSIRTGEGLDELESAIGRLLLPVPVDGEGAIILAARQKEALTRALRALIECETLIMHNRPGEVTALPLRAALEALGEMIGHVTHDALLDRIFSSFCIGK
ncbi:tRNA modification GTPase MnmE [Candidatus Magnetaquicoccaceae bacterium FCR-1]|uniref:tRNA modification GTPase MnmE n=1 Tax=Candidatus Magnetaquiglobus chichijimensis TaxID=3141448 RepID=A0ABQ0CCG0_9PROT